VVARLGPLPPPVAAVEGDHRGADALLHVGQPVVSLAVEGGVDQNLVLGHAQRCLPHGRAALRGVIGRAEADGGW
jgi:hypothetical protein